MVTSVKPCEPCGSMTRRDHVSKFQTWGIILLIKKSNTDDIKKMQILRSSI